MNVFPFNFRMKNQSLLVLLLLVIVASLSHSLPADNDDKIDEKENEIVQDNDKLKIEAKVPKAMDPRFNKMLPMKTIPNLLETAVKAEKVQKSQKPTSTEKVVKDETSTIGNQTKLKANR